MCPALGDSESVTLDPMETRETIPLDARAQQPPFVLGRLLVGELSIDEGASYLRLSTRHVRRLLGEIRADGASAPLNRAHARLDTTARRS